MVGPRSGCLSLNVVVSNWRRSLWGERVSVCLWGGGVLLLHPLPLPSLSKEELQTLKRWVEGGLGPTPLSLLLQGAHGLFRSCIFPCRDLDPTVLAFLGPWPGSAISVLQRQIQMSHKEERGGR